jgi:hypothetical protein
VWFRRQKKRPDELLADLADSKIECFRTIISRPLKMAGHTVRTHKPRVIFAAPSEKVRLTHPPKEIP